MQAYYVAATNRYFWQTIGVRAPNKEAAADAFRAFLATPASKGEEEYEWKQAAIMSDRPAEELDRASYVYSFDDADIEECDEPDAPRVTKVARMLDSGGNG